MALVRSLVSSSSVTVTCFSCAGGFGGKSLLSVYPYVPLASARFGCVSPSVHQLLLRSPARQRGVSHLREHREPYLVWCSQNGRCSSHTPSSGETMGPTLDANPQKVEKVGQVAPSRTQLYPTVEPYNTGFLQVSDLHNLYWEENGNPTGQPVVFLHGGPGSGTSSGNRRFFDPDFYRIILLDQRGAGKSTPHACLEENDTWSLGEDIEKLREHLGITKWLVFGGSWGSTLSLFYAQQYPERVTGIILRGIFLVRKKEIDWFYRGGASAIYPDEWEPYQNFIPKEEQGDFVEAYHKRLNGSDPVVQLAAARVWTNWELATSYLLPSEDSLQRSESDHFALAFARVENHYFINKGFFPSDSFLLDNIDKVRHLPAIIIQGRYDIVCPMMSAWDLHKAWPEAQFKVVPNAGHSANEPGITAELVAATEFMKKFASAKAESGA